jgi:DNA-binding CsgD family transcriptional regulator
MDYTEAGVGFTLGGDGSSGSIRGSHSSHLVACGSGCTRARLAAHGWPVEPQEIEVAGVEGRRRVVVDTLTVRDGDARAVVHALRAEAVVPDLASHERVPHLTPRQLDVLHELAEGRPAKEIARRLWLRETTVRNHIRAVLRELESHSQLEA